MLLTQTFKSISTNIFVTLFWSITTEKDNNDWSIVNYIRTTKLPDNTVSNRISQCQYHINIILVFSPALHKFKQRSIAGRARLSPKLLYAIPGEKMGRTGLHTCILQLFNGLNLMDLKGQTAPKMLLSHRANQSHLIVLNQLFADELLQIKRYSLRKLVLWSCISS